MIILSDGTGQFNLQRNAACWVHAERILTAVIAASEELLAKALNNLSKLRPKLLVCVDEPAIPMHNNQSEPDIREFVIRRLSSGSTRSEDGMKCRDTFASLKKTAQRHEIAFWLFLQDRIFFHEQIAPLSQFVEASLTKSSLPQVFE